MVIGNVPCRRAVSAIVVVGWADVGAREGDGVLDEAAGDGVRRVWEVAGGGWRCWLDI